ncbi:HlyD family secretion protein [Paraburkholderia xenovorans]|uniref:HlyD family secretion protein n=1 Tax=Paraburkholderia xenovorans TaxID=36873 RepID=UPI0015588AAB|nr:HlyD family efflux transporter periplasmic adaptor subunit [Paraburkholderia xenovorans]NPT35373.1 HlyD family efflux transporter periplasmic adaptor subunit [Paraburkholderia xenovorans]
MLRERWMTATVRAGSLRTQWKRAAPVAVVIVAVSLGAWLLLKQPTSKQAFVNASVIALRAPIAGTLSFAPGVNVGDTVKTGQALGQVSGDLSNPRVSELRILDQQLKVQSADLAQREQSLDMRIADRERQQALYRDESRDQQSLQSRYAGAQIQQAHAELARLDALSALADADMHRASMLFDKGYLSRAGYERSVGTARANLAQAEAQRALVNQSQVSYAAARAGLQLDGPRALSEPEQRNRQLELELVDLKQQRAEAKTLDTATRQELERVEAELEHQRMASVAADRQSVVWSLDAQSGEALTAGSPIMQLVDCNDVWVDAFFDESDVSDLKVGAHAEVRLAQDSRRWTGVIETIRSGSGRVIVGQYVASPPPEIARRQLPVKVVTVRVRVDWKGALQPGQYCFAGRSAEVTI